MTRDDIIRMAREAGASFETAESMFRFAAIVAAAEREAALMAKLEAAERDRATFIMEIGNLCTKVEALREQLSKQRSLSQAAQHLAEVAQRRADALQAKIEAMEKQEPVAWCATDETGTVVEALGMNQSRRFDTALYLAPGAKGE